MTGRGQGQPGANGASRNRQTGYNADLPSLRAQNTNMRPGGGRLSGKNVKFCEGSVLPVTQIWNYNTMAALTMVNRKSGDCERGLIS